MIRQGRKGILHPGSMIIAIVVLVLLGGLATGMALMSATKSVNSSSSEEKASRPNDRALKVKAQRLFDSGRHKQALPMLREYLDRHSGDVSVREDYAQALWQNGDFDESLKQLERVAFSQPPDAGLYYRIGILLRQMKEDGRSLEYLEKAVSLGEGNPLFHAELAKSYASVEKYDRSIDQWRAAIKLSSKQKNILPGFYAELGLVYEADSNPRKAREAYRLGLREDPKNSYLKKLLRELDQ